MSKEQEVRSTWYGKPITELTREQLLEVIRHLEVENDQLKEGLKTQLSLK
jgi:hypothetical protein